MSNAIPEFDGLRKSVAACRKCGLHAGATNPVFGSGNERADVMFIGEAPGRNEDLQGLPFVGRAGKLLDQLLESSGMSREDVFITNVVKHRPPENRVPAEEEVLACMPYLREQIRLINPKIIVFLGRVSMQHVLGSSAPIGQMHGRIIERDGRKYFPVYHPAAALRNPDLIAVMKNDFEALKEIIINAKGKKTLADFAREA